MLSDTTIRILSLGALAYVVFVYVREHIQPANILRLRKDMRRLRDVMITRQSLDPDVRTMLRMFDYRNIMTSSHVFTRNKRFIYICTREDPRFDKDANYTIQLFTLLHEVAHIMTPEWGHTANFWQNYGVLLDVAEDIGLLNRTRLWQYLNSKPPFRLCAHDITTQHMP